MSFLFSLLYLEYVFQFFPLLKSKAYVYEKTLHYTFYFFFLFKI
uniref:Uncharacterized protein n=1 Tax=Rhizophora mucronata TaxID=61149 RepID=A0A2P2NUQ2_RHIMU